MIVGVIRNKMPRIKIIVEGWQCCRCTYKWIPKKKTQVPIICPKCNSPYWDVPRKNKKNKEKK